MNARPRIIARDELYPSMRHSKAPTVRKQCRATIALDNAVYRCGREHVDGIHDAFEQHGGGAVRW